MRLAYFANGTLGCQVFDHLLKLGHVPVVVILNAPAKQRYVEAIRRRAEAHGIAVLEDQDITADNLASYEVTRGLSVLYGHILRSPILEVFRDGIVNLHTGLLPANRGANPNVWPLVDGSPAGVTVHQIDAGVDTGPVYGQKAVSVAPNDDARALFERLEHAIFQLFCEVWPAIVDGVLHAKPQVGVASEHHTTAFHELRQLDLDANVRTGDLIDVLRACTFPPHLGAVFEQDGQRYSVRVQIEALSEPGSHRDS